MVLIGWALLGVALGAAGTELLRASKPELVAKVEDAAKRFVDSLCSPESADGEADDEVENVSDDGAS